MVRKNWALLAFVPGIIVLGLSGAGCQQSVPDTQSKVVADFTGGVTEVEVDTLIYFSDLSSGGIERWLWEFGDGATSTGQNPAHSYDAPGTYTVSLTVAGDSWEDTEIKSGYIRVIGVNQIPSYVMGEARAIYEWAEGAEASTLLERVPCYCGCKLSGHKHVRDCFWRDDGTFDGHAAACSICLDTAAMTKQMWEQGKDICEIREEIDVYYAANVRFGTDTPMPEGCAS